MQMKGYQSNDLQRLADLLEERIFQGSLFDTKYLIVPSNFLKHWLFERWAKKRCVIGIKCLSIQEAVSIFLKKNREEELVFPSTMELELFIREELLLACSEKEPLFNPLKEYLSTDTPSKISFLSGKLSELFSFYGQYGVNFLTKAAKNWQELIYRQIFTKKKLGIPVQELAREAPTLDSCSIHLFCFSYLPPAYFDFFYRLSQKIEISTYVLSFCSKYWEDLSTNFEERKLRKQYKNIEWFDSFFQTNPILANFGVLGKELQKIMSSYDLTFSDHYVEKETKHLLAEVQNDVLHLRSTQKRTCPSIQLQPVLGTKFDEIKMLHAHLLSNFKKGYRPEDIFVLAEDLNEYLPFIHTIFADQPFDYKISETVLLHQSFIARGILHILSLSYEKWTLRDLYQLFENPLLQKKFHFSQEDADLLYEILSVSKLKFGYDEEHMFVLTGKKIKDHTWMNVLQRLVLSFAVRVDEDQEFAYPYPIEDMEFSASEMLNTFIGLVQELWDLSQTFQAKPVRDWAVILTTIIDTYFSWKVDDFIEQNAIIALQTIIKNLKRIPCEIDISVEQLVLMLQKELEKKTIPYQMHWIDALHFAHLNAGNIKPSKIIYILGMNQEALEKQSSLNLLKDTKQFYPTNHLKKKYLLLEHLLLAEDKIVFSYPTKSHELSQELTPSLLLQELRSYIGDFFESSHQEQKSPHTFKPFAALSYPKTVLSQDCPKVVSISSLRQLAKRPFDFYLKQKWNVQFEIKDKNDFSLSSLEKYQLLSSSLEKETANVLALFDQKAVFPEGIFKQIAKQEMTMYMDSSTSFIQGEPIYQFQFQKDCKKPFLKQNTYVFPAVKLSFEKMKCYLVGSLFHITKQGMLVFKEDHLKEWVGAYPSYLMYLKAIQGLSGFEPNVIFLKSKKTKALAIENIEEYLKRYTRYFFMARHIPSPCLSFAVSSLLKQDVIKFEKGYHQALKEQKNWLLNRMDISNLHEIFTSWSLYMQQVFQPLL